MILKQNNSVFICSETRRIHRVELVIYKYEKIFNNIHTTLIFQIDNRN